MQHNIAHDLDEKERTKDVLLEENVTFASLLLKDGIKRGLGESGFRKPSPIQFKAIPLGRCGFDLIVKSKSGTGKTLVFSTIALETVNVAKSRLQVLILVPTREIAVQIQDVLKNIGRFIDGLCVESFIGGLPLEDDIKKSQLCHIAVGTPGRVKHLLHQEHLSPNSVRLFVLDEADKLMDPTFQTDVNEIYDSLPQRKQFIAASATYPEELDQFLANYMLSPTHVTSENETPLLLGLRQFVGVLNAINPVQQMAAKNELLLEIFTKVAFTQCLVFTNYQSRTESVCKFLNENGWKASFISAAVDQNHRLKAINNLKNFQSKILLSTDLTSRGIDASNVNLVINYDIPVDAVTYLHRMGRAGRYGSSGICINFALEGPELKKLQVILGTIGATNLSISKLPPLNGADLWQLDPDKLEQVSGVAPSDDAAESIKNEVMSLKQNKNSRNCNKKIKLEEENVSKSKGKKKKKKIKAEEMDDLESPFGAEDLLNSLIKCDENGSEDSKKRKRRAKGGIKFEDLVSTEGVQSVLNSKREEDSDEDLNTDDLFASLITEDDKNVEGSSRKKCQKEILSKNIALVTITKLLSDSSKAGDENIADSVDGYLKILKNENEEEIMGASSVKTEELDLKCEEVCQIEDVFRMGYDCALKNDQKTWLNCLPDEEVHRFQEFCRQELVVVSSESEEEEEDEDYGMEEVTETETNEVPHSDTALQWTPVVQDTGRHFEQCYEDCSNVLWQSGLTFETVSDFDNFFYNWQEQLQSVRNYIQQNIYVEEMSRHQQNRLGGQRE